MRSICTALLFCVFSIAISAQELNCTVTVNSDQVSQTNKQVFKTLERSLNNFVNTNKWTNRVYREHERVNAQMFITITEYESNRFSGTLQIQSSRPVFNTSYETPIFNYKDNQLNFEYIEFQPLIFNVNVYESNLVAVLSYYVYVILGLDADSFTLEGGTEFYRTAQKIVTQAQGSNSAGWSQSAKDKGPSRFEFIDNLLSNTYREYRVAMYNYHRKGLDIIGDNNSAGKQVISGTINLLDTMVKRRPNALLVTTFFDAKSEEIRDIFSDGPKVDIVRLKEILNKIAPIHSSSWKEIKY